MANCCVSITDTVRSGACVGEMFGDVQISLHQVGNTCLRTSEGQIYPGPVGPAVPINKDGEWTSPPLCANSDISGNSFYKATVRANGQKKQEVFFILRGDLSPLICGSTLRLSEVSLCGNSCVSGSLLCSWFNTECCGNITPGETEMPFSCSDLAACSITSLGDVPPMPAGGPWNLTTINGVISWAAPSGGTGGSCDSRGGVCSINQTDGDTLNVLYGDGTSQIINIISGGGTGGTGCCTTGGSLSGNVLTLTQSNGGAISVDLSALAGGSNLTRFYETISFQHSGPMTLNDSPEQNGWVACANANFTCGKLVYADDDGAGALSGPVTVQIYNCVTNAVLSQGTLPAGSNECAVVNMPDFAVPTNGVIKWRFTAFDASDADGATISMTFQKLQDIG